MVKVLPSATSALLVDGLNVVRRIFEARGASAGEEFINASKLSLQRAITDHRPQYAVVVWDSQETTWRHLLDDQYKANRSPTPDVLLRQLPALEQAFLDLGVRCLIIDNYEADDVIATLATGIAARNATATILSTDKMFYQLLSPHIKIYNHFDRNLVDLAAVEATFGLSQSQLIDYWALSGDNSNNVKGVKGIGKKTAIQLLQKYRSLDAVISAEDKVAASEMEVLRCKQLVTLKTDVALGVNLRDFSLAS